MPANSILGSAMNVNAAMIIEPAAAASCPFGENPPFTPASHFFIVVIILTLSSRQPISEAKVSDAATATAAENTHMPFSWSSNINASTATSPGSPPFATTLPQLRCPSIDSDRPLAVFSSNLHFVALCADAKNPSKISNQVQ